MNLKRLLIDPDDDEVESQPAAPPAVDRPWKPGWYPDASLPAVVRWWDGRKWTKFTAPNDARVTSRGAPISMEAVWRWAAACRANPARVAAAQALGTHPDHAR